MRPKPRHVVDAFIDAVEQRPGDFFITEHIVSDRKSGLEFWIGNGFPHYGVYHPFKLGFGFIHGLRFADMLKQLKSYQAIQKLREAP